MLLTVAHNVSFLQDLAIVMIVAGLVTILFHRLKQPVVLGYIIAGVIIGPHTPPFPLIGDEATIQTLSQLGIVFLMFSLGLEFSLRKLKEVGPTAFIAASTAILVMVCAGYSLGQAFGWSTMDSIFLGAILSISSTTIVMKALDELGLKKERFAQLIFGILIVEDILAIVMIAILSGFAATGSFTVRETGMTVVKLCSFLGILLVAGLIIVPRLLNYVARFKSNEMLLVAVLGLCFGVSLLAVKLEYSVALGAFLIGAIIAEARQILRIETLMEPLRDMFSAVFFVSIGLLIDPTLLVKYAGPILIITAVVVVGQVISCAFGAFIAGHEKKVALRAGMGLAQIGEFSFIIASLGLSLKVTSSFLYPIAVAVSALTTLITPYLIRSSDGIVAWFDRALPKPVTAWLDLYTRWVEGLGKERSFAMRLVRKWAWQLVLNLILVTGVFVTAASLRRYGLRWWPEIPRGEDGVKAALWLAAMLVSLPLLIAIFRKLRALSMLLSEMSISRTAGGREHSGAAVDSRQYNSRRVLGRLDAHSSAAQLRDPSFVEVARGTGAHRRRDRDPAPSFFHQAPFEGAIRASGNAFPATSRGTRTPRAHSSRDLARSQADDRASSRARLLENSSENWACGRGPARALSASNAMAPVSSTRALMKNCAPAMKSCCSAVSNIWNLPASSWPARKAIERWTLDVERWTFPGNFRS